MYVRPFETYIPATQFHSTENEIDENGFNEDLFQELSQKLCISWTEIVKIYKWVRGPPTD